MIKAVFHLDRKEGTDQSEFERHWQEDHAPIATEGVPGLLKYTISFPADVESAPFDGMAQLYFEDEAAADEGLASEAMEEAVADVPNFADPDSVVDVVVEEHVQVDRT